ncbi:peroxidase-related enzyme [Oceanospirillaceae bacterium]|nr:peroxidase-related enzyme [Oceanospirillaceae bacterium]
MSHISRYPVAALDSLPADIKSRVLAVQEKAGFVPNIFLAMAHRPDELRAFMDYHDALMIKESGLTQAEREMIIVATSSDNGCLYCVVAHGAVLRIRAKDALVADQVAINHLKADISARQKAMLTFALKISNNAQATSDEDFTMLKGHGFSEDDTWDIAAITAFFGLSNRLVNFASIQPNKEFYNMARDV